MKAEIMYYGILRRQAYPTRFVFLEMRSDEDGYCRISTFLLPNTSDGVIRRVTIIFFLIEVMNLETKRTPAGGRGSGQR